MLIAEAFGALAVILNFIGYRQDNINHYLLISAAALAAVSTHFFLLGAMAAGIGCALACVRNVIAMKYRGNHILMAFVLLNIGFLLLELFVLEHGLLILVAYASSLIFTVGSIAIKEAAKIRRWFILAESLGLIYAVMVGSIFGTIFNISNLCSIAYKLIQDRHAT